MFERTFIEPQGLSTVSAVAGASGANSAPEDLVRLFYAIQALSLTDQSPVVQFIASIAGEGTSTVAAGLARVAAGEPGRSALLVDCAAGSAKAAEPASLITAFRETGGIGPALSSDPKEPQLLRARLSQTAHPLLDTAAADLRRILTLARERAAIVVLDCPSAATAPDSLALSRYCDSTILVIATNSTSRRLAGETQEAITRLGGRIGGVVLNRVRRQLPRWLEALV